MSDIEIVDEEYKLSHPLDDGGSDDNDIDPSELKRKKKKTQKVLMKDAIESVLKKTIKKEVIFLKSDRLKLPLKKTKQEYLEKKAEKEKKERKELNKLKGHYIPRYELDRQRENQLKSIAMKGVVKLFNAIHDYQMNNPVQKDE